MESEKNDNPHYLRMQQNSESPRFPRGNIYNTC